MDGSGNTSCKGLDVSSLFRSESTQSRIIRHCVLTDEPALALPITFRSEGRCAGPRHNCHLRGGRFSLSPSNDRAGLTHVVLFGQMAAAQTSTLLKLEPENLHVTDRVSSEVVVVARSADCKIVS